MASFFRLGHSRSRSSSTSGHSYHPQPDFASTFDAPSDDEDDDHHTVGGGYDSVSLHAPVAASPSIAYRTLADSSIRQASSPPPPHSVADPLTTHAAATASTSSSSAPLTPPASARTTTLPGGYDFEPQAYEGGSAGGAALPPPVVRQAIRPVFTSSGSRISFAAAQPSPGQRYGVEGESYGADEAGSGGGGTSWRGLLSRFAGGRGGVERRERDGATGGEGHGLLFDESDETDTEQHPHSSSASYPPRNSHLPLLPRPPQFAPPPESRVGAGRVFGGGQGNDGVFANLSAKPDGPGGGDYVGEGPDKDEVLPAYEAAVLDSTPPYWETTVITPGGFLSPDDVCVDGMPVGNLFSFAWNLLVSMSFQFVGFLLTYLLHTTHAAKNGSRAGLGITLIQLGFWLKQRADHPELLNNDGTPGDETGLNGGLGPGSSDPYEAQRWSWWGGQIEDIDITPTSTATATPSAFGNLPTQIANGLVGALDASDPEASPTGMPSLLGNGASPEELDQMSIAANEWMSFLLVTVGSFLLIGGCLSYWRAVRYARAMRQGQGPGADTESMVAIQ
ncbi:hypothetical protein JCM1841_004196 [Sporobolomyces salmonicolor]